MSRIIPFERSFASHPCSANWSDQNTVQPENVSLNSHSKYWFNCSECNHKFEMSCANVNYGQWCPYCTNQLLCDNNICQLCFDKSFASHEKSSHWSDQNELTPRQVFKCSGLKFWFNCVKCYHKFYLRCADISYGKKWCQYCANQKLCNDVNCEICFNKSFASHEKAPYWSDKNELTPRQVFKSSNKKYWFKCDKCNHEFQSDCGHINDGKWCSYCASCKLCDDVNCKICFNKSFASHEKAQFWSDKNTLTPSQVFKCSSQKCSFTCDKCNHNFELACSTVNAGQWCPYCSNHQLCDDDNCELCFNKSFASHEKSPFWSDKNELTARQVFKCSSSQKCWFNCNKCNSVFQTLCYSISNKGQWCPKCKNKTELILYDKLKELHPSLIHQFKAEWCKIKLQLPFDFLIPEHNIIIELDGIQHFQQVSNWTSPEITQDRDKFKMKCAKENGYSVIRLLQKDVFENTFDWLGKLIIAINKIIDKNEVQILYICKNNEYDVYQINDKKS